MNNPNASRRQFIATASVGLAGALLPTGSARAAGIAPAAPVKPVDLPPPPQQLPRTHAVLLRGMEEGRQIGAQIYVSVDGRTRGDFAVGLAKPGVPLSTDTLLPWYSCTKPVASMCIAQLWERGRLELDDPVAKYIPEFAQNGKEGVTIRHLLTHTAGFPNADVPLRYIRPYPEIVAAICRAKLEPGWIPGRFARYHGTSAWYVLGEIVHRVDGRTIDRYVRTELFEPLGMKDSWIGMPRQKFETYGDRIGVMMDTDSGTPLPSVYYNGLGLDGWAMVCAPSSSGQGPIRELGRFYEALLMRGSLDGRRVFSPQTVEAFTACHRFNVPNYGAKGMAPFWGLGFHRQRVHGGKYASPRMFGHAGSASSVSFCDPENRVVVAVVCNGRVLTDKHATRMAAITTAVYEDLGLTSQPIAPSTGDAPDAT